MVRRFILGCCVVFCVSALSRAQESTEPPPPVAAPRTAVMSEELPRAGAVVVFGADQPLGLEIAKALAAAHKQVAVVVRDGADRSALDAAKIEVAVADAHAPDQLKTLFTSMPVRAVVVPHEGDDVRLPLDAAAVRNIVAATKAANVPRLVFVSETGAGDSSTMVPWYVRFLRSSRFADAELAEQQVRASGLDSTIVRAGWMLDEAPAGTARIEERTPAFTWITHGDLSALVASLVDTAAARGKTITAVDPERASLFSVLF